MVCSVLHVAVVEYVHVSMVVVVVYVSVVILVIHVVVVVVMVHDVVVFNMKVTCTCGCCSVKRSIGWCIDRFKVKCFFSSRCNDFFYS